MSDFQKINKNVLICGIVKNCASQIKKNIQYALETLELFNNSKIIIYENNSTDGTKDILNEYSKMEHLQKNITIISEDIDLNNKNNCVVWSYKEITGSDHPCRIEFISKARNKVVEEFNKPEYNHFEYVIWIDFDSSNGWDKNGIIDSFNRNENWDALFGNNNGVYYDYYALRYKEQVFGPEIIGEHFWNNISYVNFQENNCLIPVYSSFNGIGIYKKELFKKFKYDFLVNDEVKKFYRNIIKYNITDSFKDDTIRIIENKCDKFPNGYKDENTNIFWKSNSGYNMPIICEHVALNLSLFNNDYKLYINPKLIYHR
jgi:hypothetical protein